jgi:signal peptidase I
LEEPLEDLRSEEITEPVQKPKSRPAWVTFLLETVQTVILAVVLYFLIDSVVARVRVENISMEPTLLPGQFILVNKLAVKLNDINRGDIIVFHHSPTEDYIKRVIGLPGDSIVIRANSVYVNNQKITEPYIAAEPAYNGSWVVPEGELFVLGDNRNQSSDSHEWGYVPINQVIGKALVIYWPLNEFKTLSQPIAVSAKNGP